MNKPKHTIRTMPLGQAPAAKQQFAKPPDSALPPPDRGAYTYIVCDDYQMAIEYAHAKDLWPGTTRYVSRVEVLVGVERPRVIVVGDATQVPQDIVEALARRQAEVTYDRL